MSTARDGWSDPGAVNRKLDAWWKQLRPDRRRAVLDADIRRTLPDWLAQELVRAGLPLEVNPGIVDRSLVGLFVTPPLVEAFLAAKRVEPPRKWWQFWRR